MVANGERAMDGADVVLLLVNHSQFGRIPREALAGKTVIDTRGVRSQRRSDTLANFRSKSAAPAAIQKRPDIGGLLAFRTLPGGRTPDHSRCRSTPRDMNHGIG
jgi:hypothetical protein